MDLFTQYVELFTPHHSVGSCLHETEYGTVYTIRDGPRESVTGRASSSCCPTEVRAGMDTRRRSESPAAIFPK